MKNLQNLVPAGHTFMVDTANPHMITVTDLDHLTRIGILTHRFMSAVTQGLQRSPEPVADVLFNGLDDDYRSVGLAHPHRHPVLTRIDLMLDDTHKWRIAEIDPSNKHGLGIGLAVRIESGAGERQKLIPLLAPLIKDDMTIVLGSKEAFFWRHDQRFFAEALARATGKKIEVISEERVGTKLGNGLILDFPFCHTPKAREILGGVFQDTPDRFINPPRHMLGGKALMSLPFQYMGWLAGTGMQQSDIDGLKEYLPPTYTGPFVVKETFSSGAHGVTFHGRQTPVICQNFVSQCPVEKPEGTRFMRLACYYVGEQLTEIIATATPDLPVHCGQEAINYHVNVAA